MVEGVLVVGSDGRILLANPSLRKLFEIGHDVEGQRPIEAIRNVEIEDLLKQARDAEEPAVREVELGGSRARVLRAHAAGIPTADGERGAVAVFHDVTEARRVEAVRRDFVTNASHELRTPLTAILGFAETLLASKDRDEAARAQVRVIHRNSERLARLVDDLLELSRIESGGVRLEPAPIDVARVAESVLESLAPRLKERSIEARVVDDGAPQARADRRAVEHVLENLLDNAAKYTEPGGRIEVRARREGDLVAVDVADTGIGISEADQIRVFERFYRVDRARSRDLGGTGLGLSIVKHLVQAMGGEVRLRSALGLGSTFTFTLPSTGSSAPRC
jgi:two-component system phosphate regulon sensor histidine kinase PhoR